MPADKNWKTTKLVEEMDQQLLDMAQARIDDIRGVAPPPPPNELPPPMFLPVDPETERRDYAELIAFILANKDPDTAFTHASIDDFMQGLDDPDPASIPVTEPQENTP